VRRIISACAKVDAALPEFYFAYGSNMDPARVAARGLRFDMACNAVLDGVRLTFDKQSREHPRSGHANLSFDRVARAEGVLYHLTAPDDIARMDVFEAAPVNYSRDVVVVSANGHDVIAWTYFANAAVIRPGLRPERAYLKHLLAGRCYLSPDYVQWLSQIRCVDD
jgi:cation transport regulator ChaC